MPASAPRQDRRCARSDPYKVTMTPIPASAQSPAPHDALAPQAAFPSTLEQPRLLLVDDEPRLLSSLYELLQGRGYQLITASTGSEALAHLSKLRFDLVL